MKAIRSISTGGAMPGRLHWQAERSIDDGRPIVRHPIVRRLIVRL